MNVRELQAEVGRILQGIEHPRVGAALALGEECGELMRCVLEREIYGSETGEELADEIGDVLVTLAEVCERYELSLEACARHAIAKLEERAPKWRDELGDHLRDRREAMD